MAHKSPDAVTDAERRAEHTETGLDENVAGALSYVLGVLTGVLFFVLERDNEFVRFHAAQSIAVFGGLLVLSFGVSILSTILTAGLAAGNGFFVFSIVSLLLSLVWLVVAFGGFVLWLYLMFQAYQGKTPRVPIAAGIADKLA